MAPSSRVKHFLQVVDKMYRLWVLQYCNPLGRISTPPLLLMRRLLRLPLLRRRLLHIVLRRVHGLSSGVVHHAVMLRLVVRLRWSVIVALGQIATSVWAVKLLRLDVLRHPDGRLLRHAVWGMLVVQRQLLRIDHWRRAELRVLGDWARLRRRHQRRARLLWARQGLAGLEVHGLRWRRLFPIVLEGMVADAALLGERLVVVGCRLDVLEQLALWRRLHPVPVRWARHLLSRSRHRENLLHQALVLWRNVDHWERWCRGGRHSNSRLDHLWLRLRVERERRLVKMQSIMVAWRWLDMRLGNVRKRLRLGLRLLLLRLGRCRCRLARLRGGPLFGRTRPLLSSWILFGEALLLCLHLPIVVAHPPAIHNHSAAKLAEHALGGDYRNLSRAIGIRQQALSDKVVLFGLGGDNLVEGPVFVEEEIGIAVSQDARALCCEHKQLVAAVGNMERPALVLALARQVSSWLHLLFSIGIHLAGNVFVSLWRELVGSVVAHGGESLDDGLGRRL